MHPIRHIRTQVFGISQKALGEIVGVPQATVSRWESGALEPSRSQLELIRAEALRRGLRWNDSWFFSAPEVTP